MSKNSMFKKTVPKSRPVKEVKYETKEDSDLSIDQFAKQIKTPISDSMMDYLDAENDKLNESNILSEKIEQHNKLKDMIQLISIEVDNMVDFIDKLDVNAVTEELLQDSDKTGVEEDIVNMDKMLVGLKDEEVMQVKIKYLERLINMLQKCKAKCDPTKMRISKCN